MANEAQRMESAQKSELSNEEQIKRLRSAEYFAEQKNIQLLLLKNERALGKASEILSDRRIFEEKVVKAVRQMMTNNINTFPDDKKSDIQDRGSGPHALATEDPRKIVMKMDSEWKEYNERYRDDVGHLFGVMDAFAKKYELDFNPYFRDRVDADTLWKDLQKAYEARLFELENDINSKEHDFRDM